MSHDDNTPDLPTSADPRGKLAQRERAFGPTTTGFLWCLHCMRTYQEYDYAEHEDDGQIWQMCPYADCDGDAVVDAWDWANVRGAHSTYPEKPVWGTMYPLYP